MRPAYFDAERKAWMLSRYCDVAAALRNPAFRAPGFGEADEVAHTRLLRSAMDTLPAERVAAWRPELESLAAAMIERCGTVDDLVGDVAEPWSHAVAMRVLQANPSESKQLWIMARDVFAAGADPFDSRLRQPSETAAAALAARLPPAFGPVTVQAFAALSQSLPCFLSNAWLALLEHPVQTAELLAAPASLPLAIEELLRFGGPSRAQFRSAGEDVAIGGASITRGSRVVLLLSAANRDPEVFPQPDRLDWNRSASGHLAFGAGGHSCVGAALVRQAAAAAIPAFLRRFESWIGAKLSVQWSERYAIRSPYTIRLCV